MDSRGRMEQINHDETLVFDIRRHIIGLIFIYLMVIVGLGLAFTLIGALLPGFAGAIGVSLSSIAPAAGLLMLAVVFLAIAFLLLATIIYRGNQLIVTNLNITQVLQIGLFNRKVSELTMGNVEDVTARQNGILQTLFNYGTIVIETAGEQNNFIFKYAPNPNAYAKAIQDARGDFLATYRTH